MKAEKAFSKLWYGILYYKLYVVSEFLGFV